MQSWCQSQGANIIREYPAWIVHAYMGLPELYDMQYWRWDKTYMKGCPLDKIPVVLCNMVSL